MKNKTEIFESYEKFLAREDKLINGVIDEAMNDMKRLANKPE